VYALRKLFCDLTGSERALLAVGAALVVALALHHAASGRLSCCGAIKSPPKTFVGLRA